MFAQENRRTVLKCYRINEFDTYPREKKTKKIQKDVFRKTRSISPPVYDISSVYTGPLEPFENTTDPNKEFRSRKNKKKKTDKFDLCQCNDNGKVKNIKPKHRAKTWDSLTEMYGNVDTTEVWLDPQNQIPIFQKGKFKRKHHIKATNGKRTDLRNDSRKHKRKAKIRKTLGNQNETHIISEDVKLDSYPTAENTNQTEASVISLFRKGKNNKQLAPPEFQKNSKSKAASPENLNLTSFKEKCLTGPCTEETNKNSFLCRCKNRRKQPEIIKKVCTDDTCGLSRKSLSMNSVVKIKDKILCICHKYSQKLVNMTPNNNIEVIGDQISTKHKISKQSRKNKDMVTKKENESEQTGEPFFEIQVNPSDMCVLNPIEIRENILKYGRPEKNEPKCICPSRGRIRPGEVCKHGVCKKAYKNKQVDFNCWCEKQVAECGDATCDALKIRNKRIKQKNAKNIRNYLKVEKPLLEVQLDMDKMCVVNPKEIEDKIIHNINVDDVCSSGVCKEAALKRKTPFLCKCIGKKINSDITECTEDTCLDATKRKKSKFSLFCTRICSKSENWSQRNRNRDQKRIQRRSFYEISPSKLGRGRIITKSDNLRVNDIKDLNNRDVKQNNRLKPTTLRPRAVKRSGGPPDDKWSPLLMDFGNIGDTKASNRVMDCYFVDKLEIKQFNTPNKVKNSNAFRSSPRAGVFKSYNSNNVKQTQISKELRYTTNDVMCACAHKCECDKDTTEDIKIQLQNTKFKEKQQRKKLAQKKRSKKNDARHLYKEMKQRAKLDKKQERRAAKERLREIKMMQKKMNEEPLDTNFCTAFLLGILKIGLKTVILIFTVIIALLKNPRKCYWYVRDRINDPEGTFNKLRKWLGDALMIKKLQIAQTVRGSDTLTILADHFLDTPFYQSFADKGKTKEEQALFEQKSKARKRRIRKREQQAIFSCRHMLLTTLRQTPCLWVYHICPNFYPQCLSLLAFMHSFTRILLFLAAFACWTPCILTFELCRACLCCFMCTG